MVVRLFAATFVIGACSYPLPADVAGDGAPQDTIVDTDPANLTVTNVAPASLLEGLGTGGSRPGILVVSGSDIADNATLTIVRHGETTPAPGITINNVIVAANHQMIAAEVTVDVDPSFPANSSVRLDVVVSQPAATVTLSAVGNDEAVLVEQGLDELTGNASLATGVHVFSQVNAGSLSASDSVNPLVVRAVGSLSIGGLVSVNANGRAAGPFGTNGGQAGPIFGQGGAGVGAGGGLPSGCGGGFGSVGGGAGGGAPQGQPELVTLGDPNRGYGGAGGNGNSLNAGGEGGGGGGSLELTAGGTITLQTVEAKGGNGQPTTADDGGGGSGGVILLRSTSVTANLLDATGGTGSNGGGVGRIRIDTVGSLPSSSPVPYRGPMLAATTPLIVRMERPSIGFVGQANAVFKYQITNADGSTTSNLFDGVFAASGTTSITIEPLFQGLNTLCVYVDKADTVQQRPEARNCVQLAFLP